jgi:cystathionine gamma-lyase
MEVSNTADEERIRGDNSSEVIGGDALEWFDELNRGRKAGPSQGSLRPLHKGISTRAVHSGTIYDDATGAVGTPIYQNTTFLLNNEQYNSFSEGYARDRFIYTRYGNPSQWAVQNKLASLENAESAVVFSSGMAAISTTIMALVDHGGHVVASRELYGGTYNLLNMELPNIGMSVSMVDARDLTAIEEAITPDTQILFFEAITNPLLTVVDIPGLVDIAQRNGIRLVIDATFMTPAVCQPLDLGVDVVVHSATKYLNGHSDLMAGVATGSRKLVDQIWGRMLNYGGCLDPHGCFLLERGLKTLAIRMKAHADGAMKLASYLETHPAIKRVFYPQLESHPDHEIAGRLMRTGTGMISFEIDGGDEAALQLLDSLSIPKQATSLGGVETLISLPFNSSHSSYTNAQRTRMGINPGCIRLSVGIEDPQDLIADFEYALEPQLITAD